MPRIALTTTPDRAARLVSLCEEHGLEPVGLPCIELVPADEEVLEQARRQVAQADWLVVTSSRAISVLWPNGEMPDVPVAAVGPATAQAVTTAGGRPAVVGGGGVDELIDLIAERLRGVSVVFPHAAGAGTNTIEALEVAGASVDARAVYEIRSVPPADDAVDAVAFGSPTAVHGWLLSRDLEGLVVGAIGETTAGALEEFAVTADVEPPHPSFEGLIVAMAEHLRDWSKV
ncbi:MAG: uroporphyrinogen-III synthase [Actinomycetota bacterium]